MHLSLPMPLHLDLDQQQDQQDQILAISEWLKLALPVLYGEVTARLSLRECDRE